MNCHTSIIRLCYEQNLTPYEVFEKAYASFIGKPLAIREYSHATQDCQTYLRKKGGGDIPHYVSEYLERERKKLPAGL